MPIFENSFKNVLAKTAHTEVNLIRIILRTKAPSCVREFKRIGLLVANLQSQAKINDIFAEISRHPVADGPREELTKKTAAPGRPTRGPRIPRGGL
jgi:hypothetical protein